jgi:hypothetical protein
MNPDKRSQDEALRRSGDTSLEKALSRNITPNRNSSPPILVSPFLLQRAQPTSRENLRSILQAALDLTSSEDLDINLEFDEEFEALERSLRG